MTRPALCGAIFLLITACAGPSLDPAPPVGFNLSGEWRLVADKSDTAPDQGFLDNSRQSGSHELARHGISNDYPVVYASRMKIEQNRDSMGIRYDQSEYRDISWGKRERGMWTVDAGWSSGALYIYSKAHDSRGVEIMHLSADGNTLTVDVEVHAGEKLRVQRVFRRG